MNINYDLYKNFYYVAKQGSVSKAAESLEITQSALSQSIKQLEILLNKKLFNRTSKGMILTKYGELLFHYVKSGIRYFHDAENKLKDFDEKNVYKTITIATTPIIAKYFVYPKINNIKKILPNVNFIIKSFNGFDSRINALRDCIADIAIIKDTKSFYTNEFEIKKIKQLNYTFFYNPNFFTFNDEIQLEELCELPLIIKNTGSQTKKNFMQTFNLTITPFVECEHDEMIIELVKDGLGIGFAPKEYLNDTFKTVKVIGYNSFNYNILTIYRKNDNDIKHVIKCLL